MRGLFKEVLFVEEFLLLFLLQFFCDRVDWPLNGDPWLAGEEGSSVSLHYYVHDNRKLRENGMTEEMQR